MWWQFSWGLARRQFGCQNGLSPYQIKAINKKILVGKTDLLIQKQAKRRLVRPGRILAF